MRVNRVERREHERRSGQDRRKMPDRKNSKMETIDRRKEEKRKEIRREEDAEKRFDDQIEGRNSVLELLESGKDVNKIFVTRGEKHGSINKILGIAKERKIIVVEKDKKQMDEMAQEENYQGVIAIVPPFEYVEISDILEVAKERNEDPFVIVLDGIEDPHNLGSIIRTAETAGVHGVIIPKRRAVSVNSTVNKASAGAVEHMKIARVTNISDAIEELKQAGLWVCGTAVDTNKYYYNQDLTGLLVILIFFFFYFFVLIVNKKKEDRERSPMKGKVQSLNASVSTGIVVYEAVKQRIRKEN